MRLFLTLEVDDPAFKTLHSIMNEVNEKINLLLMWMLI